jgi:hypothetical protein
MTDYKKGLDDGADVFANALLKAIASIERNRELCSERGFYSQTLTFEQIRGFIRVGLKAQGVISGTSTGSLVEVPDVEAQGNR